MTAFVLLALSWLMPLHFMPWVSWHSEAIAFAAAIAMALGLLVRGRTLAPLGAPRVAALFLVAAGLILLQAATGLIEFWGDVVVLELYAALCFVGLTCGYVQGRTALLHARDGRPASVTDPVLPLAWMLALVSMVSAVIALVQLFDLWTDSGWIVRMPELRRPGGNLAQPNHLGTLLLMGLASLVYLRERLKIGPTAAIASFGVIALGLAVSESRTALLGLLVLSAWCVAGQRKGNLSIPTLVTIAATAAVVTLYICWPHLMAAAGVFQPGAAINARPGMRLVVWPQLMEAIALKPLQGWGLHEVSKAHNAVVSAHGAAEPYTYAHNILLELAIGCGIPATLLGVAAFTIWCRRRSRQIRTSLQWYCVAALLPFCVHSMLEFPYAYAYFLLPVTYLVGVLEAECAAAPLPRPAFRLAAFAAVPMALLAALSVYDYLRAEEDFRIVRFEAMRIGRTPSDYVRPRLTVLTQVDALLNAGRLVPHVGMSEADLKLAQQAALRYPWPATQNRYALALTLNGSRAEAMRQLKVIHSMHGDAAYRRIDENWRALAGQHPEWADKLKH